jgi:phage recombination protein Bet
MVVDYCKARKLDPMKKPCHIVPMNVKDAKTNSYNWRDVVMPGIYEYRTTAQRTGEYLGHSAPEFGPEIDYKGVKAPAWCAMTMYRRHAEGRIEFPVRVYFSEAVSLDKNASPNSRWSKAPIQMLTKCAEAAGLREAFPDEFGGEATAEEMEGQGVIEAAVVAEVQPAKRKSETAAAVVTTEPAGPAVAIEPEPNKPQVGRLACVGHIAKLTERGTGLLVELETGFVCATKEPAFMAALKKLKTDNAEVDLGTRPSSDPAKYAPTLEEIRPVRDAGADDE